MKVIPRYRISIYMFILLGALYLTAPIYQASAANNQPGTHVLEGYPTNIMAEMKAYDQMIYNRLPAAVGGLAPRYIINRLKVWDPGSTIHVAFMAGQGSTSLRQQIAAAASQWAEYGNVNLVFGPNVGAGQFYEWSPSDTSYSAEVRISFNQDGYWSMVGRDSISVVKPGEASMNFGGFDQSLPSDWTAVVLHEFGHALGFEHEHQRPKDGCEDQFLFDPDPGYQDTTDTYGEYIPDIDGRRPGIYKYLEGPPNNWTKDTIDFNLLALQGPSSAFDTGLFDVHSIMMYSFPDWMLKTGTSSRCWTPENMTLSDQDKTGFEHWYPFSSNAAADVLKSRRHLLNLLLNVQVKSMSLKKSLQKQLHGLVLRLNDIQQK